MFHVYHWQNRGFPVGKCFWTKIIGKDPMLTLCCSHVQSVFPLDFQRMTWIRLLTESCTNPSREINLMLLLLKNSKIMKILSNAWMSIHIFNHKGSVRKQLSRGNNRFYTNIQTKYWYIQRESAIPNLSGAVQTQQVISGESIYLRSQHWVLANNFGSETFTYSWPSMLSMIYMKQMQYILLG